MTGKSWVTGCVYVEGKERGGLTWTGQVSQGKSLGIMFAFLPPVPSMHRDGVW